MALVQIVTPHDLCDMATRIGRRNNFGFKGWMALGEYLEQLSDDIGEDIPVDVISLCCEYSMARSVEEWIAEWGPYSDIDPEELDEMTESEKLSAIEEYLLDNTSVVICEEDCIIWQSF